MAANKLDGYKIVSKKYNTEINRKKEVLPREDKKPQQLEELTPEASKKGDYIRRTFICYPEDVQLIMAISLFERRSVKDILHEAMSDYIVKWREAHEDIHIDDFK